MHELSIAESLLEQILFIAKKNNLKKITKVELETGACRAIIPEALNEAFNVIKKETIAKNALLTVVEIKITAKCRKCKIIFNPQLADFQCPKCGKAQVEILSGNEIILKSISGKN